LTYISMGRVTGEYSGCYATSRLNKLFVFLSATATRTPDTSVRTFVTTPGRDYKTATTGTIVLQC